MNRDQPGYRSQQDPGCGVRYQGTDANAAQYTLSQLGHDNKQANRKQFLSYHSLILFVAGMARRVFYRMWQWPTGTGRWNCPSAA